MKPIFENINPNAGTSFFMDSTTPGCCEAFWHIHPEYEIVYIKNGGATYNIGSYHSKYEDGMLVLIGSNIPHSNLGNDQFSDNIEVVIQMSPEFLERKVIQFPEFHKIAKLLERSMQGILFNQKFKKQLGNKLETLKHNSPEMRLIKLLELLNELAHSNEYTLLNTDTMNIELQRNDYNRINLINEFVRSNFQRQIQLSELSKLIGLTESSFSRFFKKVTSKSFISYLNEFRIQQACLLMADKKKTVAEIMYETGFNEPAHFTRIFKRYSGLTPRDYKNAMRV